MRFEDEIVKVIERFRRGGMRLPRETEWCATAKKDAPKVAEAR